MDLMAIRRVLMAQRSGPQITMNGADYVWTDNYYLGQTNKPNPGVADSNTRYYKITLDFIPCSSLVGRTVQITSGYDYMNALLITCAFYSSNNETSVVGYVGGNNSYNVPSNAQYCRFCTRSTVSNDDFYLSTID